MGKTSSESLDHLKIRFDDVVITYCGTTMIPGDQKPTDQVTFAFRRISVECDEITEGRLGTPTIAAWGMAANRPG